MQGYIKLYRKIRENPIFNDMELFRLWMICLTEATHKERDQIVGRQTVRLLPGDFVTGRFALQDMYNHGLKREQQKSPATLWRWIETLEKGDFLIIKSSNKFSVISILNWHKYQFSEQENEQQVSNKRATSEQQVSTNNNDNKRTTCPKQVYDEQSIPYRTANYLYSNILKHKPDLKKPNLQIWANDMRKLIELDKRDPKKVGEVIEWATQDSFWQTNILSASKLRDKWDSITARMKSAGGYKGGNKNVIHFQEVQVDEKEREHLANMARKQAERNGIQNAVNE